MKENEPAIFSSNLNEPISDLRNNEKGIRIIRRERKGRRKKERKEERREKKYNLQCIYKEK